MIDFLIWCWFFFVFFLGNLIIICLRIIDVKFFLVTVYLTLSLGFSLNGLLFFFVNSLNLVSFLSFFSKE